jgi:A/G-specific adenine glycosylase
MEKIREINGFAQTLLKWFEAYGRELPWRETHDPYAIWLSEIILQQTQVKQGWDYWQRFMRRWSTVDDLAAASEDEVLREWQGLGYYSRARNLHNAAQQIVALGHFPDTLEEIKQLKGVGDYTAAAIGSIAFGLPAAVVDGNVYRVLARYFGVETAINSTEGKKEFAALAQSLLPETSAGLYNQAIMDFGAIQCTPQSPKCVVCPLQESCEALRTGKVSTLPVKEKKLKIKERHLIYIYIRCQGETAIHRRGEGDIWQGLWEPVLMEDGRWKMEEGRWMIEDGLRCVAMGVKHVLTHRVLTADFYLWETETKPDLPEDYIWIKEEDIDNFGIPRLIDKLLKKLFY